jgi:hypothetical protein
MSGTLDLEVVAVIVVELLQGLDDQVVDREPYGPRQFELPPNMPEVDSPGS